MKASKWEYQLRELLATLIYVLGFWAPWERYTGLTLGGSSVWTAGAALAFRQQWMGFSASSRALLLTSTTAAILAALLRWWAGSYPQPGTAAVRETAADGVVREAGPFRFFRNPLSLGALLHVVALSLLMPPSGALVAILLMIVLELRLIGFEEALGIRRGGPAYADYLRLVPRLFPTSLRPLVPAAPVRANWFAGLLAAVLFIGTAAGFLVQGSTYNGTFILRWVLIAFGLQLIVNATQGTGRRVPIA